MTFDEIIKGLEQRVQSLEQGGVIRAITLPDDGKLIVPNMPTNPDQNNGAIYYNTSTGKIRIKEGGVWVELSATVGSSPSILDDLADVIITTPANDQVLTYETSSAKWKNKGITVSMISDFTAQVDANTRVANAYAHLSDTNNPHSVTASQVGKDIAQWNADRIYGVQVDLTGLADEYVLAYDSGTNTFHLINPSGSGEANTASNLGTGAGVYKAKVGVDLQLRSIKAGSGVSVTQNTDEVEVANTDGGAAAVATHVGLADPHSQYALDTDLTNHLNDTTDAHDASAISNVPAGGISATDVQSALNELDTDKEVAGAATTAVSNHVGDADPHTQYQKESEKGAASGYASLDGSSKVVENPANATATPTASKIPIADGSGKLDGWITTKGYTLQCLSLNQATTTDAQTMYWGSMGLAPTTTAGNTRLYIPKAGIIKAAYIYVQSGTAGTAENWSQYIRLNNTTDTLVQTVGLANAQRLFSNTGLSISVNAGDYIEIKEIQPTWATNPANVRRSAVIYLEVT